MLHSTVAGVVGMPDSSFPPLSEAGDDDTCSQAKDALILRAKDAIAGRTRPPALATPPEVDEFLRKEFGGVEPPPTREALRRIADRLSLESLYGGRPVACFTMADGGLAVLACGGREIEALLRGLSDEEAAKVVILDTEPF